MRGIFYGIALFAFTWVGAAEPKLKCERKWGEINWEGMTFKRYRLRAEHFPSEKRFDLIVKSPDGRETQTFQYRANRKGHLILQPLEGVEGDVFAVCPVKRGERITFLMRSEDGMQLIQAEVIPFPIELKSKRGAKLSLELVGEFGEKFLFTGDGFSPYEDVALSCHYGENLIRVDAKVSSLGRIKAWITLPIEESGEARLVVQRKQEEILFPFNWGGSALKLVGACCLEVK